MSIHADLVLSAAGADDSASLAEEVADDGSGDQTAIGVETVYTEAELEQIRINMAKVYWSDTKRLIMAAPRTDMALV